MIAKGNLHAHGQKLAAYLITGKKSERAELAELRGFTADNIRDAFLDVHIQSEATRCEKPFFHVQVRLPQSDTLDRAHWLATADRIETQLGFEGQGRAVAFHEDRRTGERHMHIAWSRIDLEEMRAIDPGLFKNKLKEVSRQLEQEYGLTPVPNERPDHQQTRAAGRQDEEQARRLGTDLKAIRETIRDCWDRSDNGKSLGAALVEKGLILARGDKRDFVVVDHAGGDHALGKRITGATAAQTRERLADIDRQQLPSVAQAKETQAERQLSREVVNATPNAAKTARERNRPLTSIEQRVLASLKTTLDNVGFAESLSRSGLKLARVTAPDIAQLDAERALGHRRVPAVAIDELVAVDRRGVVHQLSPHRVDLPAIEQRLVKGEPGPPLRCVAEIRAAVADEWREKVAEPGFTARAAEQLALRSRSGPRLLIRSLKSIAAPLQWLSDRLGGGKPNPEMMTPEQRSVHATEQQHKAAAAEANAPTISEIERQEAIRRAQQEEDRRRQILDALAEQQRARPASERERDDDHGRERERER